MLPFVSSSGCSTVVAETASSLGAQGATGLTTAVLPEELSDSDVPIASEETLSFEDVCLSSPGSQDDPEVYGYGAFAPMTSSTATATSTSATSILR